MIPIVPSQHWLLKNARPILKNPLGFFMEQFEQYGDFYCANTPIRNSYVATHPDYVRHVLIDQRKKYVKSDDYKVLQLSLGTGLLTSEGEFWQRQRRIAQPAFHKEKIAGLVNTMAAATLKRIKEWEQTKPQQLNMGDEMMSLALDIAAQTLFGAAIKPEHYEVVRKAMVTGNHFLSRRITTPLRMPMWVPTPSHLQFFRSRKSVRQIIMDIIEQRRRQTTQRPFDLLTMLLEARDEETGEGMTDQQLYYEVLTLFLAGHETTANALSWAFYLLGSHPEVVEKLMAELDAVLPPDGYVTNEHLPKLVYTQQVIEETMRLYPPAWTVVRKAAEEDKIGDYTIPKDGHIVLNIYGIHRHPKLWEQPDVFMPERFEAERRKQYDKHAYIPFSAGQRMCIGNIFALVEMKIVIAMLFHRFRWQLLNKKPVEWESLVTLRPKDAIFMSIDC